MPEPEERRPCPVCLGVKMTKRSAATGGELTLDRCDRCGGIWFDAGEVMKLRTMQSPEIWRKVMLADEDFKMSCHGCHQLMDRDADACPACGWGNALDCPVCTLPMDRREVQGLHLDFCTDRHGVWFDRIELAEIWNLQADSFARRTSARTWERAGDAAYIGTEALDFLLWNPDVASSGVRAVGDAAQAVASVAADVAVATPEVLGIVAEGAGELAGGVFEAIFDVVGSIFG